MAASSLRAFKLGVLLIIVNGSIAFAQFLYFYIARVYLCANTPARSVSSLTDQTGREHRKGAMRNAAAHALPLHSRTCPTSHLQKCKSVVHI